MLRKMWLEELRRELILESDEAIGAGDGDGDNIGSMPAVASSYILVCVSLSSSLH